MTEEWLDFIIYCRSGRLHKYDIVEGPMADDTIFNYVQNVIDKKISRAAFWELAKFRYPTHQLSFHTIQGLSTLKFERSYVVDGRENDNALFFTCSLIEYIGRKQKLKRKEVVEIIGGDVLKRIYEYADVFHCEPIEKVADEFIEECKIQKGNLTMRHSADMKSLITGQ